MASNPQPFGIKIQGFIGEKSPTVLTTRRRGRPPGSGTKAPKVAKKPKRSQECDEEIVDPGNLLSLEVNETDEFISPPDFNEQDLHEESRKTETPKVPPLTLKLKKSDRLKDKVKKVFVDDDEDDNDGDDDEDYNSDDADFSEQDECSSRGRLRCEVCNRTYKKRKILIRHMMIHEGSYQCPICEIPFKNKMSLGKHIATHEKDEKCEKCPATFHTKEQLAEHYRKKNHIKPENKEPSWYEGIGGFSSLFTNKSQVNYDVQTAIVSKLHKAVPVQDICRLYNVTPELVNSIWDERDKYILPEDLNNRRTAKYIISIVEPPLLEWYNKQKSNDGVVTGRMLQTLAEKIAIEKGIVHFHASDKWIERFKKRHNIYFKNGEKDYTNFPSESVWKSKFFEDQWKKIRLDYTDDEIYMADEVGLYYNPSKSREKKVAGKKFIQGEAVDRLSIFVCTNMSGGDKRKLMVCGTEDPLEYSHRTPSSLPVEYRRQGQCLFTTNMFEEYVHRWNKDLADVNQKAVLMLDRASIHSKITNLSNLRLEFLPWKSANTLMAIKNVYPRLRTEFRNLLLKFKTMNVMRGQDRKLTCLEAIEMVSKAWERVPKSVITKGFLEVGFEVQSIDNTEESEDSTKQYEMLCEFLKDYDVEPYFTDVTMLDMYLTIVEEDQLVGRGTNPSYFGGNHKPKDEAPLPPPTDTIELPLNTDRPMSNEKELFVKKTRALADLEIVRKHLQSKHTSYETYCNFMNVEKVVMENFVKLN